MPLELKLADPDRFRKYSGGAKVYQYQILTLGLIAALLLGLSWSTRGQTKRAMRWRVLEVRSRRRVMIIAAMLGGAGLSAWLYMIANVGGFQAAYGSSYGGGWASSGYIREMRYLGLVGALLVFVTRTGRGMRVQDWLLIAICTAPTLIHALLGARRGPLFLGSVTLFGGYIYFMRKRVSLPVLIGAGLAVGGAMLFLVANRGEIHFGAQLAEASLRDPTEFLIRWNSNEYLIGGAVVQYTNSEGAFYGRRELAWLIGRLLPNFVWPSAYGDLANIFGLSIDLTLNGGVSQERLATITNWTPSVGSAEGFTGSLYLEFGWLAPFVSFLIGAFYGKVWRAAKASLTARVFYLLMVAMSVYLVMQALDPWLYRLLLYGIPAYLIARRIRARPVDAEITGGGRVCQNPEHGQGS